MNRTTRRKVEVNERQMEKARDLLKREIKLSTLIDDKELGRATGDFGKIRCPLHNESTPSFIYEDDKGVFNCFGCGKGGSVVELYYHSEKEKRVKYTFIRAIQDLAKEYNIELPNLFNFEIDETQYKNNYTRVRDRRKEEREKIREKRDIITISRANSQYHNFPVDLQYKVGITLDEYYLGESTAREVVKTLNNIRQEYNQQYLERSGLVGTSNEDG